MDATQTEDDHLVFLWSIMKNKCATYGLRNALNEARNRFQWLEINQKRYVIKELGGLRSALAGSVKWGTYKSCVNDRIW